MKIKKGLLSIIFCAICFILLGVWALQPEKNTVMAAEGSFQETEIDFEEESDKEHFVPALGGSVWNTVSDGKFYTTSWSKMALNMAIPTAGEKYVSIEFTLGSHLAVGFLADVNNASTSDFNLFFNANNKAAYVYQGSLAQTTWKASYSHDFWDSSLHNLVIKIKDGVVSYTVDGTALYTDKTFDSYKTAGTEAIYLAFDGGGANTCLYNIKLSTLDPSVEIAKSQSIDFSEESDASYFVRALGATGDWTVNDGKYYAADWKKTALNIAIPTAEERYISIDFTVQSDAYFLVGFLKDKATANHGLDYSLVFNPTNKAVYVYQGSLSQTTWKASKSNNYCDGVEHKLVIKISEGIISYAIDGESLYAGTTFDNYQTNGIDYIYLALESSAATTCVDNIQFSTLDPSIEVADAQSINFNDANDASYFVNALGTTGAWTVNDGKYYATAWKKMALDIAIPTAGERYISIDFTVQSGSYFLVGFLKDKATANDGIDYSLVFNPANQCTYVYAASLAQRNHKATHSVGYTDGKQHNLVIKVQDGVISYAIDGEQLYASSTFDNYKANGIDYIYLALESSAATTCVDNIKFSNLNPDLFKIDFSMVNGAAIRLTGNMGLRFETEVKKNELTEILAEGTVLIPDRLLSGELTLSTENVLDVPRVNYFSGDGNSSTHSFTGVLTEIPDYRYNEEITARSYVVYKVIGSDEEITVYSNAVTRSVSYVAQQALESGELSAAHNERLREILAKATGDVALENFETATLNCTVSENATLSRESIATEEGYGLRVTPSSNLTAQTVTIAFREALVSGKPYLRTYFHNSGDGEIAVKLSGLNDLTVELTPTVTSREGEVLTSIPAGFCGYLAWELPETVTQVSDVTFTVNAADGYVYYTFDSILLTDDTAGSLYGAQKSVVQQRRQIESILDAALYTTVETTEMSAYSPTSLEGYEHIKAVTYDGMTLDGGKTKVFAYIGFPQNASKDSPVPAMVLVHGGGGHPYLDWVKGWNDRGYAAIAMETTGYFPKQGTFCKNESDNGNFVYGLSANADFAENGYVDSPNRVFPTAYAEVEEHWATHGLLQVTYAHNILRQDERVDRDKIGITGVSWGGVTTSLMIGYDTRYAFAIPVYGTAYLGGEMHSFASFKNEYVHALWAAEDRLDNFKNPIMWWAYNDDNNFSVPAYVQSYTHSVKNNPKNVLVMLGSWSHSHGAVFLKEDSYSAIFADSIVKGTTEFVSFETQPSGRDINCSLRVPEGATVKSTTLYYIDETMSYSTFDKFGWGNSYPFLTQYWQTSTSAVTVDENGLVSGSIPQEAKGYYLNIVFEIDGKESQVSSVYVEV